jgi:hypothetical protein
MSKEKPVYRFVRRGDALLPEMDYDMGALDGIAQNEGVIVDVRQGRSNPRLRAYWAMLRECINATECAPNAAALHEAVKLNTGHVTLIRSRNGMTFAVPGSIAFDKMTEPEMVAFFRAAERWLASEFGFVPDQERNVA